MASMDGLLMHSNSLQSCPKSMPSTISSASDSPVVTSEDVSVLLESFETTMHMYHLSEEYIRSKFSQKYLVPYSSLSGNFL